MRERTRSAKLAGHIIGVAVEIPRVVVEDVVRNDHTAAEAHGVRFAAVIALICHIGRVIESEVGVGLDRLNSEFASRGRVGNRVVRNVDCRRLVAGNEENVAIRINVIA